MRDKIAEWPDNVCDPALADPDLGHHIPNEIEVDLRYGCPHGRIVRRHGNGHVGLRILSKVNWSEVGRMGFRLEESGIPREVRLTPVHIHGYSRYAKLLPADTIKLTQLGNRRHMPQELYEVEAPLFEGGGRVFPWGMSNPPELALDSLHELLDLESRRLCLLHLDADDDAFVVLVAYVGVENSAGHKDAADQRDENYGVLPKNPDANACRGNGH